MVREVDNRKRWEGGGGDYDEENVDFLVLVTCHVKVLPNHIT